MNDWPYSVIVKKHFLHPQNFLKEGEKFAADGVGEVGSPACGDVMKIYLKIEKNKNGESIIKDVKFETLGCAAAIAVSSALTDMVKGMTLEKAMSVTKDNIVKDLGGLPVQKIHCSMLGVEALHEAIEKYARNK